MRSPLKRVAIGAIGLATVASGSLSAVAAHAESTPLNYTCTVLGTGYQFPVTIDTAAPAQASSGKSFELGDVSAKLTIADNLVGAMRDFLAAKQVKGSVDLKVAVNGQLRTVKMAIDPINVPTSGAIDAVSKGQGGSFTPDAKGDVNITAGDFTGNMVVVKTTGEEVPLALDSCIQNPGQNNLVDVVKVSSSDRTPQVLPASDPPPAPPAKPPVDKPQNPSSFHIFGLYFKQFFFTSTFWLSGFSHTAGSATVTAYGENGQVISQLDNMKFEGSGFVKSQYAAPGGTSYIEVVWGSGAEQHMSLHFS